MFLYTLRGSWFSVIFQLFVGKFKIFSIIHFPVHVHNLKKMKKMKRKIKKKENGMKKEMKLVAILVDGFFADT